MKVSGKIFIYVFLLILYIPVCYTGCNVPSGNNLSYYTDNGNLTDKNNIDPSLKPVEPVIINFFTTSTTDKAELDYAIDKWYEMYPDIIVECTVVPDNGIAKIRAAIIGGEKIDVVVMEGDTFRDKADKLYYKLNDLMENDDFHYIDEFGDFAYTTLVNEDIYGIAKTLAPEGLWINRIMFESAGLQIPDDMKWTFEEYFDILKNFTKTDGEITIWGGIHWQGSIEGIMNLALYGGWDIVTIDGKPNIDDPVLLEAVKMYYRAIVLEKNMPGEADIRAKNLVPIYEFTNERAATLIAGTNLTLWLDIDSMYGNVSIKADESGAFKLLRMPRWDIDSPPAGEASIVSRFALTSTTRYPEEAYKFLKWYCTNCLIESSLVAHRIPVWKKADYSLLIDNWKKYIDFSGNIVNGKNRDDLYAKMLDPNRVTLMFKNRIRFSYSSVFLEILQKELILLFSGEKDLITALETAKTKCERAYIDFMN